MQKRDLNLWHRKDFFAPTPFVRQPLFEISDKHFISEGSGVHQWEFGGNILQTFGLCRESGEPSQALQRGKALPRSTKPFHGRAATKTRRWRARRYAKTKTNRHPRDWTCAKNTDVSLCNDSDKLGMVVMVENIFPALSHRRPNAKKTAGKWLHRGCPFGIDQRVHPSGPCLFLSRRSLKRLQGNRKTRSGSCQCLWSEIIEPRPLLGNWMCTQGIQTLEELVNRGFCCSLPWERRERNPNKTVRTPWFFFCKTGFNHSAVASKLHRPHSKKGLNCQSQETKKCCAW